ncbi:hypothetical protein [Streptomyces sp. JJ36]|uniref:hypothetical protein n=1 Tax=Streptomyces sp. JJ36 TaxID=2736645 RepID=UPI001F27F270|nr:hypothetical protein [Streptomyces sp. JJ36]MCF6523717.1 hypothetical protein [Streptomyces sp. JJ36]
MGALGLAAGGTAGPLMAEGVLGSEAFTSLPLGLLVLGSAGSAPAATSLMRRRGRAVGLAVSYAVATLGALLVVAAGAFGDTLALLLGSLLLGAGNNAVMLGRYVAADAAPAGRTGRAVSAAMTAVTVGAVAGPALLGPAGGLAPSLGLPEATGLYLLSAAAFPAAAALALRLQLRMHPRGGPGAREGSAGGDPGGTPGGYGPAGPPGAGPGTEDEDVPADAPRAGRPGDDRVGGPGAGRPGGAPAGGVRHDGRSGDGHRLRAADGSGAGHATARVPGDRAAGNREGSAPGSRTAPGGTPPARRGFLLALGVLGVANLVMVTAMGVTPARLHAHGWGLDALGVLVAAHVAAMFAPSALSGRLCDRAGPVLTAVCGSFVLLAALPLLATGHGSPWTAVPGMLLLGLGWNVQLVSGSALVVQRVAAARRHRAEGLGESAMGLGAVCGTLGLAGPLVAAGGLPLLCLALGLVVLVAALPLVREAGR